MNGKLIKLLLVEDSPADARRLREMLSEAPGGRFELHWIDRLPAPPHPPQSNDGANGGGPHESAPDPAAGCEVILLDLSLPDAQGAQAFAAARARWPARPIILLSDTAEEAHRLIASENGAQDHLLKGRLDPDVLARAIRHAMARCQAEAALAQKQNLLRQIIDALPDHIFAKGPDGRFLIVNTATRQFFGAATADELIGRRDDDLFPPDVAEWFRREEQALLRSGQSFINREALVTDAAGARRWVLTNKVPMRDADGRVVGIVGVNRDITERKLAEEALREANAALARREQELLAALADLKRSHEELRSMQLQLVQAEKMESVGRLAAGVAHEVKNPLAVIAMGLEYLSNCTLGSALATGGGAASGGAAGGAAPAAVAEAIPVVIKGMRDAVGKADQVIRGLLDFSAPSTLSTAPHDLNAVIEQTLLLVRHETVRAQVQVRKELAGGLPPVRVDANKVEQVFVNLFVNAVHAMPRGGTVTIRTSARRWAGGEGSGTGLGPTDRVAPGDAVVVAEVEDTGPGIPGEQLQKVFDPFFTTKAPGKGTGLGLTVSRTIVELHGGVIEIGNRAEGGVRVTVAFKADGTS